MGAAHRLVKAGVSVTILESLPRLGGDCFGVDIQLPGRGLHRVDAGVTDFNQTTFVRVKALLDELGLEARPIVQDTAFMRADGELVHAWRDGHPTFGPAVEDPDRLRAEIVRFNLACVSVLDDPNAEDMTLGDYLRKNDYSSEFFAFYAAPRAMGCFPMPNANPASYRVRSLVAFWRMHGIVGNDRPPERMCVIGGMHEYTGALTRWLEAHGAAVRCSTRAVGVVRREDQVEIRAVTREDEHLLFHADHVVLATNPHEVVPLLEDPSDEEASIFAAFRYQRARLTVHTDARLMPRDRDAWGAFNYVVPEDGRPIVRPTITFHPNLMNAIPDTVPDVFVSMNPHIEPDPSTLICNRFFEHPIATGRTHITAARLSAIQGQRRTWFAGSYLLEPIVHEQAMTTGQDVAERLLERI